MVERAARKVSAGGETLLQVRDLKRYFDVSPPWLNRVLEGKPEQIVRAVDGIDFDIAQGETLSLVGESGCGKSTVARLVVGLYRPSGGSISFEGRVLDPKIPRKDMARLRRRMQMIFQDPYASLNPRWRVFDIIAEPIRAFKLATSKEAIADRVGQLLRQVRLTPADGLKYPHEFSGGQRQRISIARALASEPEFLVCDEPTSALDVSVQAQILNLMKDLQREFGLTYLFISHNLAVVEHVASEVAVMYLGRFVERNETDALFHQPRHPYTKALLQSVLTPEPGKGVPDIGLGDVMPDPANIPPGCRFNPRCRVAIERCRHEAPTRMVRPPQGMVECHLA
jgi:peptide/nickel transport system ATP-binding protein